MKKYLSLLITLIVPLFVIVPNAFAQTLDLCSGDQNWYCLQAQDLGGLLGTVINFAFVLAVILAFGFLIFGGIKWITSGGDKGGVESARNTIIAAIIGLILVFLAYLIVSLVVFFLTGENLGNIDLPTISDITPAPTPA